MILSISDMSTHMPPPSTNASRVCDARARDAIQKQVRMPVKWPSRLVPPEYGTIGTRYFRVTLTFFTTLSVKVGYTTTLCRSPEHSSWHHCSFREAKKGVITRVMSIWRKPGRLQLVRRCCHRISRKWCQGFLGTFIMDPPTTTATPILLDNGYSMHCTSSIL